MDKREALHLSEQVLELRVLVATVAATNVVEPADLAEEVVCTVTRVSCLSIAGGGKNSQATPTVTTTPKE